MQCLPGALEPCVKPNPFSVRNDPSETSTMLVNKLSVADARRLLKLEGVELDGRSFVRELAFTAIFAATSAYAVATGGATVWHLFMPLVASWFGLVTAIPIVYLFCRHPAIKVEAFKALGNLALLGAIIAGVVFFRMTKTNLTFSGQFVDDARVAWRWVTESGIHWAMLAAYFNIVSSMPARVHNLMEFGPPFAAVGIGCATQLLVLFTGVIVVPLFIGQSVALVWWLWGTLLFAKLLALYLHWDVGKRLRNYDAARAKKV